MIIQCDADDAYLQELGKNSRRCSNALHSVEDEVVGLIGVRGEGCDLRQGVSHHVDDGLEARIQGAHCAAHQPSEWIGRIQHAVVDRVEPTL